MKIFGYPNCCTAEVITEFEDVNFRCYPPKITKPSAETIKGFLINECVAKKAGGWGVITCITTDKQEEANKALEELGWLHSDWMSKTRHMDTKIKLWWIPLETFRAPVVEVTVPEQKPVVAEVKNEDSENSLGPYARSWFLKP